MFFYLAVMLAFYDGIVKLWRIFSPLLAMTVYSTVSFWPTLNTKWGKTTAITHPTSQTLGGTGYPKAKQQAAIHPNLLQCRCWSLFQGTKGDRRESSPSLVAHTIHSLTYTKSTTDGLGKNTDTWGECANTVLTTQAPCCPGLKSSLGQNLNKWTSLESTEKAHTPTSDHHPNVLF